MIKKFEMKQVFRNRSYKAKSDKKPRFNQRKLNHPKYGTSKLEEDFARDFLDKLGLEYEYQFEARDIGRFYDFKCGNVLIEIDGDYYHANPLLFENDKLNSMQKRNKRIDEYKDRWALLNGYPILRIWEHDIRNNPEKVMKILKERFYIKDEKKKTYRKTAKIIPRKTIVD